MEQNHDIDGTLEEVHRKVTSSEPIARDLSRHLVDLVGRCPSGSDGSWTRVIVDEDGRHLVQLPTLSIEAALRLSCALAALGEENPVRAPRPGPFDYELPFVVATPSDRVLGGHHKVVAP